MLIGCPRRPGLLGCFLWGSLRSVSLGFSHRVVLQCGPHEMRGSHHPKPRSAQVPRSIAAGGPRRPTTVPLPSRRKSSRKQPRLYYFSWGCCRPSSMPIDVSLGSSSRRKPGCLPEMRWGPIRSSNPDRPATQSPRVARHAAASEKAPSVPRLSRSSATRVALSGARFAEFRPMVALLSLSAKFPTCSRTYADIPGARSLADICQAAERGMPLAAAKDIITVGRPC
jgi:hypothetical protein